MENSTRFGGSTIALEFSDCASTHRFDPLNLGDVGAKVALDAHFEGDIARRAPDARPMEPDLDGAVGREIDELDVPTVGLDGGADEVDYLLHAFADLRGDGRRGGHEVTVGGAHGTDGYSAAMKRTLCAAVVIVAGTRLGGCSSTPRQPEDPVLIALDAKQGEASRVEAVRAAFARAVTEADRIGVRTELTPQVWSNEANEAVKVAIVRELLNETSERGKAEVREELRLNLPLQSSRAVVAEVCKAAAERGWTEFVPAVVRTWAAVVPGIEDEDRVERATIVSLLPNEPVERTVFGVFVSPPADTPSTRRMRLEERYRLAAWEVVSRLDVDGTMRIGMLQSVPVPSGGGRTPFVDELLAASRDLGVMPAHGEEVLWLRRLRDGKSGANAAWWNEAASAVARLSPEQREGLELRHVEPVRWAAAKRGEWLGMSKARLDAEVAKRLDGRPVYEASGNRPGGKSRITENYAAALPKMSWPDTLTLLVVEEGVRTGGVVASLFTYAGFDERDTRTEYGGLLQAVGEGSEPFIATLYPPRPGDRFDDRRFVASQDMIDAGDRSLAHWHFHVAERSNSGYAGPSLEDLEYAQRMGRTCLVMTSVDSRRLNVDYFQRGGVIVDLGIIERP